MYVSPPVRDITKRLNTSTTETGRQAPLEKLLVTLRAGGHLLPNDDDYDDDDDINDECNSPLLFGMFTLKTR